MSYSHLNESSMMTHNIIHDSVDPSIEICRKPHLSRVHCDSESHHSSAVAVHQHTPHSCQRSCCASAAWPIRRTPRPRCRCPRAPGRPLGPAAVAKSSSASRARPVARSRRPSAPATATRRRQCLACAHLLCPGPPPGPLAVAPASADRSMYMPPPTPLRPSASGAAWSASGPRITR